MSERGNRRNKLLDRYIGIPLTIPAAIVRLFERRRIKKIDKMAILCMGAIGDTVLLSGLISGLVNELGKGTIDIYTTKANSQAALLLPHINTIHSYGISEIPYMIKDLRSHRYDLLLDSTQWARMGAIISAFSRAGIIAGFKTEGQFRSLPYDIKIRHSDKVHEYKNFLALGGVFYPNIDGQPFLIVPEVFAQLPGNPYIVCHMWATGSHEKSKQWGDDNWAELAGLFISRGYTVVWSGGAADKERTEKFLLEYFPGNEYMINSAGKLSLLQTAAVLAKADALVSVDTGIKHIGSLLNVPTVGLHGPSNPIRWGPAGERSKAVHPAGAKMTLNLGFEKADESSFSKYVKTEQVVKALEELGIALTG
ncbi:MAG: glycosyltransferase family 9 protein [Deferribacteraceae bacterium]|jgi:ADP-heptose:LPS heptosyltransferase|nr:glycosyltransferase family 9 protein [Deferribacteraceae bacterium]